MGSNVSTTFISCPKDPRKTLGIKLPYIVLLVKDLNKYFTFEIQVFPLLNIVIFDLVYFIVYVVSSYFEKYFFAFTCNDSFSISPKLTDDLEQDSLNSNILFY